MRPAIAIVAIALFGCSSQGEDAEKRYDIVSASGDAQATCIEAGKVKEAYLAARDKPAFAQWVKRERQDCASARLCQQSATGCQAGR